MMKEAWVVAINEEVNSDGPSVPVWEKHSIYKVPSSVTALNEKAYKPVMVSFGPYHNGEEHLKDMEVHKHRALIHFLKRCNKPIGLIYHRMEQVVQELRDSYNPLDFIWIQDGHKFLKMMILDGCFMLEILRDNDDYADKDDPVFGKHGKFYVFPFIQRDMLMLENQIPLMVLRILIQFEIDTNQGDDELLMKRILKFFSRLTSEIGNNINEKCMHMHVLEVFRKSMSEKVASKEKNKPKSTSLHRCDIGSATELKESGVRFKISKTRSLRDVSFSRGVLSLPQLVVDDSTEYIFLNLLAFERLHVGAGDQISSYVCFMDDMIDSEMDVALLRRKGIIVNDLGSDKNVAELFNSMSKEVTFGGGLDPVRKEVNKYQKKLRNKWRANLIQTYFRNPWAGVSLVAAIFLFALTIVQTVYTVAQYYQN